MSGHSKWANIKHKKAKTDAARGVSFAKFSREIIMAAKIGGGDINGNFRLEQLLKKQKLADFQMIQLSVQSIKVVAT